MGGAGRERPDRHSGVDQQDDDEDEHADDIHPAQTTEKGFELGEEGDHIRRNEGCPAQSRTRTQCRDSSKKQRQAVEQHSNLSCLRFLFRNT